jgi:hypothetical protein
MTGATPPKNRLTYGNLNPREIQTWFKKNNCLMVKIQLFTQSTCRVLAGWWWFLTTLEHMLVIGDHHPISLSFYA